MKLSAYSKNRILETFAHWNVPKEFADSMYNYLVYGFEPGGCFTSVLANDFNGAIRRSHPANTIEALKALSGWIVDTMPTSAHGNYNAVNNWINLSDVDRRAVLEKRNLIFTSEEEMILILQGKPTHEPVLY
jgi:hypothetical protein